MSADDADVASPIQLSSLRSDEPILSVEEDRLSRGRLVDVIAKHLVSTDLRESMVIALNAPWGAGKSSFLNLLEQRLSALREEPNKSGTDELSIIRFNPWHFRNIEQLVQMFFGELVRVIGTRSETRQKIGRLLTRLGSVVRATSSISPLSGTVGTLVQTAGNALAAEKSLQDTKAQLGQLLQDLQQRVVVFVDDIDRLEPDVTKLVFRMIRLNANFPNLVYVIAYDRLVVERNLSREPGIDGRSYLEKIVQVPFDIPRPEPQAVYRILFEEIEAAMRHLETLPVDKHRLNTLFLSGFRDHFRTIRHVKRYTNGLRMTLPPVAQEVDVVDFLAIEVIRVFHPEVYEEVARSKDVLAFSVGWEHMARDDIRNWTESLTKEASDGLNLSVKEILKTVFPTVASAFTNVHENPNDDRWRANCRVCSPEIFDRFFLLGVIDGDVSELLLRAFIRNMGDTKRTLETVLMALKSGTARRLIEHLMGRIDDVAEEDILAFLPVVWDVGDKLRFERQSMYDMAEALPRYLVWRCLRRIADEGERHRAILDGVERGKALGIVLEAASLSRPDGDESGQLLSDEELWASIKEASLRRIRSAAEDGSLWENNILGSILVRWSAWASDEEVGAAIDKQVAEDDRFLEFVGRYERKAFSLGGTGKVARERRMIADGELSSVRDMDSVKHRLEKIASGSGTNANRAAELVGLFHRDGKPRPSPSGP